MAFIAFGAFSTLGGKLSGQEIKKINTVHDQFTVIIHFSIRSLILINTGDFLENQEIQDEGVKMVDYIYLMNDSLLRL